MKYLLVIILILIIIFIYYHIRKRYAIKKVLTTPLEAKITYINSLIYPFGFRFDPNQEIIISLENGWQKDLGYNDLYDLNAPFFNMVFDCEPIYFDYDKKHYRLEFWKGQYGITTGSEIGLYIRDFDSTLPKGFYRCANYYEYLEFKTILFKGCQLFKRKNFTWWLTGFKLGEFSKPQDLNMKIFISFYNKNLMKAFIEGLLKTGYNKNNFTINGNEVIINFCKPLNYNLNHKRYVAKIFAQTMNKLLVNLYMWFTKPFLKTIDKLTYLKYMFPILYKMFMHFSIPRKKYKKNCSKP